MKFQFCLAKPEEGGVALDDSSTKGIPEAAQARKSMWPDGGMPAAAQALVTQCPKGICILVK